MGKYVLRETNKNVVKESGAEDMGLNEQKVIYTRMLDEITKADFLDVGGKGANLGEMINSGLPVPGGFVLLTASYRRFIQSNGLEQKINTLLQKVGENDLQSLEGAAAKIQALFEEAAIPGDILAGIESAYALIGRAEVAVRSSATAEDLPGTSFAGQYNTYLNVRGSEELYETIKKCWASLWNYRALSYRVKQNIGNSDLAHGVVVQKMVEAEKSGILFTANPVNGRRDQMLLNSSWGLGEAIVGGEVTPDQWIMDKEKNDILEERAAKKEVMTVRKDKGIEFVTVPSGKQEQVTLVRDEVLSLLELGHKVEQYFSSPQDIEWAYQDGKFYLVQTRPITSLYPLPEPVEGRGGLRVHVNMNVLSQGMQEPLTPMGYHVYMKNVVGPAKLFSKKIKDENDLWWCQSVGGRMFLDYTELLRDEKRWEAMIMNDYFSDQDPLAAKALLQWLDKNREEITAEKSVMVPYMLRNIIPFLKLFWPIGSAMAYGTLFPLKAREKAIAGWQKVAEETRQGADSLKTIEEKLDYIDERLDYFINLGWSTLSLIAPSFGNVEKAEKMAARYLEDSSDFRLVEKSLPYNATTEMGMAMMQAARALDQRSEAPTLEAPEIRALLEKYGHRSVEEVDIGIPRWDEEPEYVLGLIKSYIDKQSYEQGLANFRRGAEEAEAAIERITSRLEAAGKKRLAARVEKMLRNYREIFGLREESKFTLTQIYHVVRRLFIEIGEELEAKGLLDEALDIFFLRFKDICSGENLKEKVAANREAYNRYMNLKAPRLLISTGESIYAAAEEVDGSLVGIPVSAGVYEGRVKVLYSPEESSRLEKGDVLVTRGTNPAWTPMFLNLGAIVMETGGPISHGAVVAREYGIPAVVGVGEATSLIKDGQIVRVNGESGQVTLID